MNRVFVLLMVLSPLGLFAGCTGKEPPPREESRSSWDKATVDKHDVEVIIETSKGPIRAKIFVEKSPVTARNFLRYVDDKFYDGTIFHRVMKDFMIQGGGMEPGLKEKKETREPIANEAGNGLKNERGTLAMARTSNPDSATAQFFINVKDNPPLDRQGSGEPVIDQFGRKIDKAGYAVFGEVTKGIDIVDEISEVRTTTKQVKDGFPPHENVPVEDVIIKSIRRAK